MKQIFGSISDRRKKLKNVKPGQFASITGWSLSGSDAEIGMPAAGAYFQVCSNQVAQKAQKFRLQEKRSQDADVIKSRMEKDELTIAIIKAKMEAGYYSLNEIEQYAVDKKVLSKFQSQKPGLYEFIQSKIWRSLLRIWLFSQTFK